MKAFALAITPSVRAKQHEKFTAHLNQSKFTPGRQDQGQWGLAIIVTPSVTYTVPDWIVFKAKYQSNV